MFKQYNTRGRAVVLNNRRVVSRSQVQYKATDLSVVAEPEEAALTLQHIG